MRTVGRTGIITISILLVLVLVGADRVATYNQLVRLDQAATAQWAQVERMRYNEAARALDTARASFPTSIVASVFGGRFPERADFTAKAGSDVAPEVKF